MISDSTCPDSFCRYRNALGHCMNTGSCIAVTAKAEVAMPIKTEVTDMSKALTADIVRQEFMGCVRDLLIWETPDEGESSNEVKTRRLFYIQGAYDLAECLIRKLEVKHDNI